MILRMLGFRLPKEVEQASNLFNGNDRQDADRQATRGIIPITEHTGELTLLERIRDRIASEFGSSTGIPTCAKGDCQHVKEDIVSKIEAEFSDILYNADCKEAEVKGKKTPKKKITLSEWIEKEFFKHHISQFKKHPIAWHISTSNETFQVLFFYHKLSGDILRNLKNRYLAKVQSYYGVLLEKARVEHASLPVHNSKRQAGSLSYASSK